MSVQHELIHRLAEPEGVLKHAEGMEENERLFIDLRDAEAKVKYAEKERDDLKAQVDALIQDGTYVGIPELGHYTLGEPQDSVTFDYKQAMMDGLFNTDQAAKYMVRKPKKRALLFKAAEPK